jgi:adenine-specific DNA-methyltransferase
MPTLEFKGKPFVYSHHLSVPFRELVIDSKKSFPGGKKASLDDNLVIHGDNLEALKALLPRYASKVDVIYIDPPYNTGNEGWAYNDKVNSPLMKEWLHKVVDRDDLERHDKWLCMMWPRLQLLNELLSEDGSIWISCNDIEAARLKIVLDEIFDEENFVCFCVWQKRFSPSNDETYISETHDYLAVYAKQKAGWLRNLLPRTAKQDALYLNPDNDPRGDWASDNYVSNKSKVERPNSWFPVIRPKDKKKIWPSPSAVWRYSPEQHEKNVKEKHVWWGADGLNNVPRYKRFLKDLKGGVVPQTLWFHEDVGHNQGAKQFLKALFNDREDIFQTPKPVELIERVLKIAGNENSIVLDSFAGAGTTAHSVLALNKEDDGNRKFILIETEDYANSLTAERVRRVIKGMPKLKDEALKKGLGGTFTFCELGEPIELERFFEGKGAPNYEQVARYVVYTATGQSAETPAEPHKDWFLAEAGGYRIHLIYKPDLVFMRGNDAALSLEMAKQIEKSAKGKPVLVYAAAKFMSQADLTQRGITFCQLPYSVHRLLGEAPDAT